MTQKKKEETVYSEESIRAKITKADREEMLVSLQACDEVPDFMKHEDSPIIEVWVAGCWLSKKLEELGATKEQVEDIGFVHGQRCFLGNAYRHAAALANEFAANQEVADKPGFELAMKLNREHFNLE